MTDLRLGDYSEGYQFRAGCGSCRHGWSLDPEKLLGHPHMHNMMYLNEVAANLQCPRCKGTQISLLPIIMSRKHHFVGGLV